MQLSLIIDKCFPYLNINPVDIMVDNSMENTDIVKNLITCANTVYNMLFATYSSATMVDKVDIIDNYINYEVLTKRVNSVLSVRQADYPINFRVTERGIYIKGEGGVTIEYTYYPDTLEYHSDVLLINNITENSFLYMLLSEYYVLEGDYEKARQFYDKFIISCENFSRKKPRRLRVSRWL